MGFLFRAIDKNPDGMIRRVLSRVLHSAFRADDLITFSCMDVPPLVMFCTNLPETAPFLTLF